MQRSSRGLTEWLPVQDARDRVEREIEERALLDLRERVDVQAASSKAKAP